jgi:hypothetical protein
MLSSLHTWQYQNKRENDVTKKNVVNQIGAIQQTPFFQCPGMSQPLDSATPARPPKVPFLGGKGMFLCFWVKQIVPVDMALHSYEPYAI